MVQRAKRTRGRGPKYTPTDEQHAAVRTRSGLGQPQEAICRHLGISMATLHRHHKDDLVRGIEEANAAVSQTIFNMATGRLIVEDPAGGPGATKVKRVEPNPTMAIWWSKVRMRWQEPAKERTGDEIVPLAINGPNATIIVKGGLPTITGQTEDDDDEAETGGGTNGSTNGSGNGSNGANGKGNGKHHPA